MKINGDSRNQEYDSKWVQVRLPNLSSKDNMINYKSLLQRPGCLKTLGKCLKKKSLLEKGPASPSTWLRLLANCWLFILNYLMRKVMCCSSRNTCITWRTCKSSKKTVLKPSWDQQTAIEISYSESNRVSDVIQHPSRINDPEGASR